MSSGTMSFKIKTPRMTSSFKGSIDEGIPQAFAMVSDAEKRQEILTNMKEMHNKMIAWSAKNE